MSIMDEKNELLVSSISVRSDVDSDDSSSCVSIAEDQALLDKEGQVQLADEECQQPSPPPCKRPSSLVGWIVVNVIATILIVFVNKSIFNDAVFKHSQVTFAAYHFFVTHITLHIMSIPKLAVFERRSLRTLDMLPLAASMCLSVVLQNSSLQYCSVPFYQTARVLLTPTVAALNFFLYRSTIPRQAAFMLIPVCAGIGIMAYFDTKKGATTVGSETTTIGAVFALAGVLSSGIYTVWVSRYHKKLEMSSIQLLHQQSLFGAVLLLFCIPFFDKLPHYSVISTRRWIDILISGACAVLINVSQFSIITGAGPVSSTVVGHGKTVCIVLLGWMISTKPVNGSSIIGIAVAISGILAYSAVSIYYQRR